MAQVPLFWKLAVEDVGELRSWARPGLMPIERPHVTLLYLGAKASAEVARINDLSSQELQLMEETLLQIDGSEVMFEVTEVLEHPGMIVAVVALPSHVPCAARFPYMTLCRSDLVVPAFARSLLEDRGSCQVSALSPPRRLRGIISLEMGTNSRATAPKDPTIFAGTLLRVETHPRASHQTEPTGNATLYVGSEEKSRAIAAELAASARERPMGPETYKLKVRPQAPGKPGHLYLKWGAVAGSLQAAEIASILEVRLQELLS
mmetsp:Transcript_6942/g.14991  ORF Transcript_6942/g.14991 Transcript_6942/m.14991 type:complete len:262 (-) Transcript_6942:97-882(-)